MILPPGWESFWQPAIPHVRRSQVAYRKAGTSLIVEPCAGRWLVTGGEMDGKFLSLPEAIEWADKLDPEVKQ